MYQLADRPDDLAIELCKKLANKLAAKPKSVVLLRRIFAVVGHIAVGQVNNYSCIQTLKITTFFLNGLYSYIDGYFS